MVQTLKQLMDKNRNNVVTITDFRQALNEAQKQDSFASVTKTKPLANKAHGLITLDSVFDPELCFDEDGHPEEFVDDLDDFLDEYGNWEVTEQENGDNTYNYMSPVETDINMNQITIVNPDTDDYESKDICFFKVNTGIDPRAGYTDCVIAIFNNDLGEHYNATMFWNLSFNVITGSFLYGDTKFFYDFNAKLGDDSYELTFSPENIDDYDKLSAIIDNYYNPTDYNDGFEATDPTSVKKTLNDLINDLLDNDTKIQDFKLNYLSENDD